MNKQELVSRMAEKTGQSKVACRASLDALLESVIESLAAGDRVTLIGFGTFSVYETEARMGRNPRTGEKIQIKKKKKVKFKAGPEFAGTVS